MDAITFTGTKNDGTILVEGSLMCVLASKQWTVCIQI